MPGFCAAAIATFLRGLARDMGGAQVCTVGRIDLVHLINVIAARATLTADLRNTDESMLRAAERRLDDFLATLARDEGVTIRARRLARFEPVAFDGRIIGCIERLASALGYRSRRMTSGAGHDAQMLSRMCPTR
jgi:N-carbamoyl-L-amino-acid hydrolase